MNRRALLSTVLGSGLVTGGCLGLAPGRAGEGTTVEIIPNNHTDTPVSLDVAVYAIDGSLLLDHSYSLPPGHADESQGVENRVGHLVVSMADETPVSHEYNPDVDICNRDGEDVHIMVDPDGINFAYSC